MFDTDARICDSWSVNKGKVIDNKKLNKCTHTSIYSIHTLVFNDVQLYVNENAKIYSIDKTSMNVFAKN